jgi:hypothetical protein
MSAAKLPLFAFHEELARRFEHFRVFTGFPQFDIYQTKGLEIVTLPMC